MNSAIDILLLAAAAIPVLGFTGGKADSSFSEHLRITRELMDLVEQDPELRRLLETAIAQGAEQNPDPDTNPVRDLESFYAFADRVSYAMPWAISRYGKYDSLYTSIDQSMGCMYFVADQPLRELEDKGYYHNSLLYHEPFQSWFSSFVKECGKFLSTRESWNPTFYRNARKNRSFNLDGDLYESPSNWKSFNDFFARKLSDPSRRPIAFSEDDTVVVSPADSTPQGFWHIDSDHRVIMDRDEEEAGVRIKTGTLNDVSVLLEGSQYAEAFHDGSLTHTFLDIDDYHRYHFPISGTVKEVRKIDQANVPGGVIIWDQKEARYRAVFADRFGWQSLETRGIVIVETDSGGCAAVVPIGMCQVSSVNFEETVKPGARVKKGDSLGYFLFGGSDIVMIFSKDLAFHLTVVPKVHVRMGEKIGTTKK